MTDIAALRDAFSRVLESAPGDRPAVLASLDAEIQREVMSLLQSHQSHSVLLSDDRCGPGARIGPYVLAEKLGEGGMGVVFRARRDDGEFDREVAIKLVGGRLFASEAERRFIAERAILAVLDHPNIVRMIDGGIFHGQRYLVMELIDGVPITEYCREKPLAEVLPLIQEVCAAIQYAHQRLIIHRDLKPSNILVTSEGRPKVLDFGIARLLEGEQGDTELNPLTRSAASPEQIRGERLTVTSDIYSLGLLLREITETVQSRDLTAILDKALAARPEERYASASDLSADLGRLLEKRPVLARRPSLLYRLGRFCNRNRALTAAVVIGLGISTWQGWLVHEQRRLAEQRFQDARRLAYTVIREIEPKLAAINGTTAVRKELLERTLVYLEALGRDAGNNAGLLEELIESYISLARVAGSASEANLGNRNLGAELLAKAGRLAERLEQYHQREPEALAVLSHFYRVSADQATFRSDVKSARLFAEKAAIIAGEYAKIRPSDARAQEEIALASWTLAEVEQDPRKMVELFEKAAAVWSRPDATENTKANLALAYRNIAAAQSVMRDNKSSVATAQKAVAIDEELLRRQPESPSRKMALAFDLGASGHAHIALDQFEAGFADLRRSLAIRQEVVSRNPDDHRAADRVAYSFHELGLGELKAGDRKSAHKDLLQAADLYARLESKGPLLNSSSFRFWLTASTLARSGAGCVWKARADRIRHQYQPIWTLNSGERELLNREPATCPPR